jgi:hypothetical protein
MSALPPKADIADAMRNVRFVPKSGHRASLFEHLVGPLRSWRHEKSQVESSEHQNNANIHYQPFPESVSEEHEIYTNYNGYHCRHVKHYSDPSVHFGMTSFHFLRSGQVHAR